MITTGAKKLRQNLTHYLNLLEQGEEIIIIRNSMVIGRLVPSDEIMTRVDEKQARQLGNPVRVSDNTEVKFRKFSPYEDPAVVKQLHREVLEATGAFVDDPSRDTDLDAPGSIYEKMEGEFWVGELNGEVVAMGGFRLHLDGSSANHEAELKRMRVRPALQGKGIGGKLLELLEDRARRKGYKVMVLDVTSAKDQEPARRFYEKHGYQEFRRTSTQHFDLIYCRKAL